jgi:iron complex outermembrane recepter protein
MIEGKTVAVRSLAIVGVSALAILASTAQAQEAADDTKSPGLGEIVVTAQKRSENLQDVPVSVSAVQASRLADSHIVRAEDIQVAVPGIAVYRGNSATQFYIRGIGTVGAAAGQEAATATFVDGVYQPSMSGSSLALNNVARIEVLKGPQGTLYGRNATAGAVNIITKTPSTETAAEAEIGYGNFDQVEASGYVTTGLASNVAIDLAARYSDQGDGYGRNVTNGDEVGKRNEFAVRSKLYADLGATRLTASADYVKENGDIGVTYRVLPTGVTVLGRTGFPYGFYDIEADGHPYVKVINKGAALTVEQDIGSLTLKSITAYRDVKQRSFVDFDQVELPIAHVTQIENNKQFTQELNLASGDDPDFNWIVGLFYLDSESEYRPFRVEGAGVLPFQRSDVNAKQDTKSYAAYGQATKSLWEGAHATVGLRYTIDERKLTADQNLYDFAGNPLPVIASLKDDVTFKKPQWRFALDQKLGEDMLLYASYSRGIKSGVYNLTDPTNTPVKPEQLDAYEVGLKSEFLDRRVRLNLAGFYYKYKAIQVTSYQGPKQILLNAAQAKIYGLDADFEIAATESLTLRGGGQYIHARYGDFPGVPILVPGAAGNVVISCPDPDGIAPDSPGFCNGRGNVIAKIPKFSANLSAQYVIDLAMSGKIALNADYMYNSGFYWEPANRIRQSAYSLVNAQIKWTDAEDQLSFRVWAKNLFDKKYFGTGFEASVGDIGVVAPPRTYGASFGFKF